MIFFPNSKYPSLVVDGRVFEEVQPSGRAVVVSFGLEAKAETFGNYKCVAENEMGVASAVVQVTGDAGDVAIKVDNFPTYSDAVLFEWSALSGSEIKKLHVQVNGTLIRFDGTF